MATPLGPDGRAELRSLVDHALAELPEPGDELRDWRTGAERSRWTAVLALLADSEGDVDAYIDAAERGGVAMVQATDIALRLIEAGRPEEALGWLDQAQGSHAVDEDTVVDLRLAALQALGRRTRPRHSAGPPLPSRCASICCEIKNPGSLATKAAKAMNLDFVLALTGTPIENRLADLWSIADRVHEGFLGDLKSFSRRYEAPDVPRETLIELKARISERGEARPPFMLRRMKEDQLEGLPAKRIEARTMEMPPVQAEAYRKAVAGARGGRKGDMLGALQRLRAASLHPLAPGDAYDDPDAFVRASARWVLAFAVLEEIAGRGEKALVFFETQALQPVLAAIAKRRFGLAESPRIINGSVAGDKRQGHVTAFQKGPRGFDLMILGPRAAGIGLTLTAANHVIHLSRWWNPAVEDQCTDRVYRIGQDKPVTVHLPQALLPDAPEQSFDAQLHRLIERKRSLSRELLSAPAGTDADMEELYRSTIGQ